MHGATISSSFREQTSWLFGRSINQTKCGLKLDLRTCSQSYKLMNKKKSRKWPLTGGPHVGLSDMKGHWWRRQGIKFPTSLEIHTHTSVHPHNRSSRPQSQHLGWWSPFVPIVIISKGVSTKGVVQITKGLAHYLLLPTNKETTTLSLPFPDQSND